MGPCLRHGEPEENRRVVLLVALPIAPGGDKVLGVPEAAVAVQRLVRASEGLGVAGVGVDFGCVASPVSVHLEPERGRRIEGYTSIYGNK